MRGMTEYLREYSEILKEDRRDEEFLSFHLKQIGFLQHERLVHLIVMLFVIICALIFLSLFLFMENLLFLVVFLLLLLMTLFYVLHYYKLENTVIEWYFVYRERTLQNK